MSVNYGNILYIVKTIEKNIKTPCLCTELEKIGTGVPGPSLSMAKSKNPHIAYAGRILEDSFELFSPPYKLAKIPAPTWSERSGIFCIGIVRYDVGNVLVQYLGNCSIGSRAGKCPKFLRIVKENFLNYGVFAKSLRNPPSIFAGGKSYMVL